MDILFVQVPEKHWQPMLGAPSLLPPSIYPESLVLLHSCYPSAEALYPPLSDFCFLRFFSLFGEERECVSFSPRHIHCVLQLFLHQFLLPSFLLPPPTPLPCAHCKCGTSDGTTLVPSFLLVNMFTMDWTWKHRNWLTHCQRIVSRSLLFGFRFCQREQKNRTCWSDERQDFTVICCMVSLFCAQSNGHLVSAKTVVFFVCFMFSSVTLTGTLAFYSLVFKSFWLFCFV